MTAAAPPSLAESVAAALDWWREAGVTQAFLDEPQTWLAPREGEKPAPVVPVFTPPPEPEAPPPERFGGKPEDWPQTLADFAPWWLAEPTLDGGIAQGRVPPRGPAGACLMVLVPQPEEGDAEAGRLLSGPQGRLLSAMLPHLGFAEEEVYLAAALPRAMPAPDWQALADAGLGEVIAHHVALVKPERLLAFGGNILPLPGTNPSQTAPILPNINQNSTSVAPADLPVLCAADLELMLGRPRSKAGFWNGWLRWTAP